MAEAVEVAIQYSLLTRLTAFAAAQSPALQLAQPNVKFAPTDAIWLRSTFLPATTNSLGVSFASRNMHYGIFQVDVFNSDKIGEPASARIAALLIQYFKRGTTMSKDGFITQILQAPYRAALLYDGAAVIIPVRMNYTCYASNPA